MKWSVIDFILVVKYFKYAAIANDVNERETNRRITMNQCFTL